MACLLARILGVPVHANRRSAMRLFLPSLSKPRRAFTTSREEAEFRARQRKAEAEADEAESRAAEAESRAAEAGKKAKAEAAEAESRAAKQIDSKWARRVAAGTLVGAALLGGGFLAYDHYTHTNRAYLRRCIREVLVAGPKESLLPTPPPFEALPLPPIRIAGNRPTLILGASGSGKSTQLGELARDFQKKGVPVVYFRFRCNQEVAARRLTARGQDLQQSPQEAGLEAPTLTVAAQRFYQAVGYPERPSYWSRWRMNGFKLLWGAAELSRVSSVVAKARFKDAISDLFAVCGELYHERKANESIAVADQRPVVLSDELHDLLHDRFHSEGGKDVFAHFGNEMTHSGADDRASRVVLAASGVELMHRLREFSSARGSRVFPCMQPDPSKSAVWDRLLKEGYSEAEVAAIMATCGTRVRLLHPFLKSRVQDVSSTLQPLQLQAEEDLKALFAKCMGKEKRLAALLDKLGTSPSSSEDVSTFPVEAVEPFPNQVLLRQVGGTAAFQTEAVREAWQRIRGR